MILLNQEEVETVASINEQFDRFSMNGAALKASLMKFYNAIVVKYTNKRERINVTHKLIIIVK